MAVDKDSVTPIPMPRNPAPVSAAGPVSIAISIIWPIADFDIEANRVGRWPKYATQAEHRQKK